MGRLIILNFLAFTLFFLPPIQTYGQEKRKPRVVYRKRAKLNFDGLEIEGQLNNPAEFYFKFRPEEKFDSLLDRPKNFHNEMLRDAMLTK